jgi:hypothetical protein
MLLLHTDHGFGYMVFWLEHLTCEEWLFVANGGILGVSMATMAFGCVFWDRHV